MWVEEITNFIRLNLFLWWILANIDVWDMKKIGVLFGRLQILVRGLGGEVKKLESWPYIKLDDRMKEIMEGCLAAREVCYEMYKRCENLEKRLENKNGNKQL